MVKIRLVRKGTLKRPIYRIVVADSRRAQCGKFLEVLGNYDPRNQQLKKDSEQKKEKGLITLKTDRVLFWLAKGAQPTETVRKILNREKISLTATSKAA
jgi:small subunit ribosomal protein S16